MVVHNLMRALQDPLPDFSELRVGRSFLLLKLTDNETLAVAEVLVRHARMDAQAVEVDVFVVYSTDSKHLPPGDTIKLRKDSGEGSRWTLVTIQYY